jgi:hypothetical protein
MMTEKNLLSKRYKYFEKEDGKWLFTNWFNRKTIPSDLIRARYLGKSNGGTISNYTKISIQLNYVTKYEDDENYICDLVNNSKSTSWKVTNSRKKSYRINLNAYYEYLSDLDFNVSRYDKYIFTLIFDNDFIRNEVIKLIEFHNFKPFEAMTELVWRCMNLSIQELLPINNITYMNNNKLYDEIRKELKFIIDSNDDKKLDPQLEFYFKNKTGFVDHMLHSEYFSKLNKETFIENMIKVSIKSNTLQNLVISLLKTKVHTL